MKKRQSDRKAANLMVLDVTYIFSKEIYLRSQISHLVKYQVLAIVTSIIHAESYVQIKLLRSSFNKHCLEISVTFSCFPLAISSTSTWARWLLGSIT